LPPHAQQISLHAHGIATIEGKQPTSTTTTTTTTNNSALQPSPVLPLGNGWTDG